jgi:hypothetical protein
LIKLGAIFGAMFAATIGIAIILHKPKPKPPPTAVARDVYPRVAMYSWQFSNGAPFWSGGVMDSALVREQAMWDWVLLDVAAPGTPGHKTLRYLRSLNPDMRLYAFSPAGTFHACVECYDGGEVPYGCDTSGTNYLWARWRAIRQHNAVLYSSVTGGNYRGYGCGYVDLAKPGIAVALADTFVRWADPSIFTDLFADEICQGITWTQNLGDKIDYVRSGYASLADWDRAYKAGVTAYFARLREKAPGLPVCGNCGPRGDSTANAWMNENWPYQPGESVQHYLASEHYYNPPTRNLLTTWRSSANQQDPYNVKHQRLVMAVATLGSGAGSLTGSIQDNARGFLPWWWDEYAVTPKGVAVKDVRFKGWLGEPRDTAQVLARDSVQGVPTPVLFRRDFENGAVFVNMRRLPVTLYTGGGLWRILGTVTPSVNNGATASSLTVPGQDAVFLVRRRGPQ